MNYLDRFSLAGKRAIVTGGARGIGLEICRALGQAGAAIILADLDEQAAHSAAETLAAEGLEVGYRTIDVTSSADVTALGDELNAERPVDILVNNAGVGPKAEALDTPDEVWSKTMNVNSDAPFWCSRAFGRHMTARGSGSIVNIGSMCGLIVTQPQNNTCYIASKGALHMMTKSLACAWAKFNVRVNAVAPGYIATDMLDRFKTDNAVWYERWIEQTPLGRMGTPQEIASAVLYLASDASSFCTGTILSADGGYTSL
ncbi:SDR family NAD(P)-dependent oxidoreductase [Mesorhizobium atlanticum]|uniref:Short-chain dehydrogenase n=1 Tax=Mesorhizobium atlanticum TaxID=2233532 RepID=A0A330GMB1_9HYPH|nr:glucose 1-dehydrogenase [Mesorhizobium atlanticum]RAZ73010.1 short-chain dehydrogenase [Mesorhizobium atlanticum]